MVDEHHDLAGDRSYSLRRLDDQLQVPVEETVGFYLRSLADQDQVQWISGVHVNALKAGAHCENRYKYSDGQGDAENGHDGSDATNDQAAEVVPDWNHSPRLRTASAI